MLFNIICYPPFTLEQATSLAIWDRVDPVGPGLRIIKDHELFPKVAVLFRHDPESVRHLIDPTSLGTVVLVQASGCKCALPTLETAMAKVLALENGNATAARAATRTTDTGIVPQARLQASSGSR